jgi:cytochrome d ubiquinol oxidase subunit I
MNDALTVHRLQFAFTVAYHYLFPQLTIGLALLIVIWKTVALRTGCQIAADCARFWARIFGLNFAMGVVTGIPLEFQFGTNWAGFSRATGEIIGQTLGMEGVFAFFLESTFLGLFLFGEKRLGPRAHWLVGCLLLFGSWLSGYFIVATNAWMQHPVGYTIEGGVFHLESLSALLLNPWLFWQYLHTVGGSVVTASFVVAGVGAFYLLSKKHEERARSFVRMGVVVGLVACALQIFPTGDQQARMVAEHQPVTFAAMEGLFSTEEGAPIVLVGQPDLVNMRLDNPIEIPGILSFLTWRRWNAEVKGLETFPRDHWPDNIPLLYYAYHIMVGLGTILTGVLLLAALLLVRKKLDGSRGILWLLLLAIPFPYIANTAGWLTAELGRQPWLVHGLLRTADGASTMVSAGNGLFSLLGFMGLYLVLGLLFLFLVWREIEAGPSSGVAAESEGGH